MSQNVTESQLDQSLPGTAPFSARIIVGHTTDCQLVIIAVEQTEQSLFTCLPITEAESLALQLQQLVANMKAKGAGAF
jgi:hypothetical protein